MNTSKLKNVSFDFSKRVTFVREYLDYFYRKQKVDNEVNKFKLDNTSSLAFEKCALPGIYDTKNKKKSLKII